MQGAGGLSAGVVVDGALVRDLQLRPDSRFACVLRPLPQRAAALGAFAAEQRRRMLRLTRSECSKARRRWAAAVRTLVLRWRGRQQQHAALQAR